MARPGTKENFRASSVAEGNIYRQRAPWVARRNAKNGKRGKPVGLLLFAFFRFSLFLSIVALAEVTSVVPRLRLPLHFSRSRTSVYIAD
jgi:hypothetical protein